MQNLTILHTREVKGITEAIKKQWNADFKKKFSEYVVLKSSKDKIYLLSRDFALVNDRNLRIDSAGMYFGELVNRTEIRLSIEGSQLVGPMADKNVVEFDEEEARLWIAGGDIEGDFDANGFVILKNKNKETGKYDFLGSGKYKKGQQTEENKENKEKNRILNYVPKTRRINWS